MHSLEPLTFNIFFFCYFAATLVFFLYPLLKKETLGKLGMGLLVFGGATNTVNLILRGIAGGRVPFANLYESLLIFIAGMGLLLIAILAIYRIYLVATVVMPVILGLTFFAGRSSLVKKEIEPLMPALQSPWMTYHVSMAIIAYGAFAVAFGLGIVYLWRNMLEKKGVSSPLLEQLPPLKSLDSIIYKVIAFAFPFLFLLIITGAIWAEKAWGTYWQWDPKETWSLITFLVYAAYLHSRYFLKWRGAVSAIFAVAGFLVVMMCYLGVNLLLSGLHSYGSQ